MLKAACFTAIFVTFVVQTTGCARHAESYFADPLVSLGPPPMIPEVTEPVLVMTMDAGCVAVLPEEWKRRQAEASVRAREEAEEHRLGCLRNVPSSCSLLAYAYADGSGVQKDAARANALFQRANALYQPLCDGGSGVACDTLASAHESGNGFPKDGAMAEPLWKKAFGLFGSACEKGDGDACQRQAWLLATGHGTPSDSQRAARLHERARDLLTAACDGGEPESCRSLFAMLSIGDGVPAEPERASVALGRAGQLWAEACTRGDSAACDAAKKFSPPR